MMTSFGLKSESKGYWTQEKTEKIQFDSYTVLKKEKLTASHQYLYFSVFSLYEKI